MPSESFLTVYLLSTGSQEACEQVGKFPPRLYLGKQALERLGLERNKPVPRDMCSLITYLKKPLGEWPIEDIQELFDDPGVAILDKNGNLHWMIDEWLSEVNKNNESLKELEQAEFVNIKKYCLDHQKPSAYYAFAREFVINHPIVEIRSLQRLREEYEETFVNHLFNCYEVYDASPIAQCPYCGWTIQKRGGQYICGTKACRKIIPDYDNLIRWVDTRPDQTWYRVRPGIQTYIVRPGIPELNMRRTLERMGYQVELYPDYDRFDLRFNTRNGLTLDLDIKDYASTQLLAKTLSEASGLKYHEHTYFIIPNHWKRLNQYYKELVERYYGNELPNLYYETEFYDHLMQLEGERD